MSKCLVKVVNVFEQGFTIKEVLSLLYKSGHSVDELSHVLSVPRSTMCKWCIYASSPKYPKYFDLKEKILANYADAYVEMEISIDSVVEKFNTITLGVSERDRMNLLLEFFMRETTGVTVDLPMLCGCLIENLNKGVNQ